jgi:hypothetical protein
MCLVKIQIQARSDRSSKDIYLKIDWKARVDGLNYHNTMYVKVCVCAYPTIVQSHLEALAVNNGWSRLIVLSLGDPHLLEGGEGGKDGATDPDGVLTLWRSDDLDLHGGRSKVGDLLLHAVSDTREHSGSTGEDGVSVEVLTDIDVALHDGVVSALVDTGLLHAEEGWLEESLWATESLVTDGDDLTIRKLV